MTIRQVYIVTVAATASICMLLGCNSTYIVSFRNAQTEQPVVYASATLVTVPRIYSFLDARHYLVVSGRPVAVKGKTDHEGRAEFSMPADLGIWRVTLTDRWIAGGPSANWMPMLTQEEFGSNRTIANEKLKLIPGRPHVKLDKK